MWYADNLTNWWCLNGIALFNMARWTRSLLENWWWRNRKEGLLLWCLISPLALQLTSSYFSRVPWSWYDATDEDSSGFYNRRTATDLYSNIGSVLTTLWNVCLLENCGWWWCYNLRSTKPLFPMIGGLYAAFWRLYHKNDEDLWRRFYMTFTIALLELLQRLYDMRSFFNVFSTFEPPSPDFWKWWLTSKDDWWWCDCLRSAIDLQCRVRPFPRNFGGWRWLNLGNNPVYWTNDEDQ